MFHIILLIIIITLLWLIVTQKPKNKKYNIKEKIEKYNKEQEKRKEYKEWLNKQKFKAKDDKPKNKFYYGKDWKNKKGADYEFYIMQFYLNEGYKVFPNGYIKGFEDGGIDLVAHKDKETILIQCKNWRYRAELKNITKFYNDCKKYEKYKSKFLNGRNVRKIFFISNEIENLEIENFLKRINNEIEFLNVPIF